MCRLLGYCSPAAVALADLMGEQELRDFTALSSLHSDGWGMAWYDGGEPAIRKSLGRAGSEPEYARLAPRRSAISAWCTCAGPRRAWP